MSVKNFNKLKQCLNSNYNVDLILNKSRCPNCFNPIEEGNVIITFYKFKQSLKRSILRDPIFSYKYSDMFNRNYYKNNSYTSVYNVDFSTTADGYRIFKPKIKNYKIQSIQLECYNCGYIKFLDP